MTNQETIKSFYQAFQTGDAEKMGSLYANDIVFQDDVFGELRGEDVRDMWRMLIERGKETLVIRFGKIQEIDAHTVTAQWEADYQFSKTGRKVNNQIKATFTLEDKKIIRHHDQFSFWRWSRMALGTPGLLFGFMPWLQNKVRTQSRQLLKSYQNKQIQ